jgi:hypothetical protein
MTIDHLQPADSTDAAKQRAEWIRPEVRMISAGSAETAFTSGSDGATQS